MCPQIKQIQRFYRGERVARDEQAETQRLNQNKTDCCVLPPARHIQSTCSPPRALVFDSTYKQDTWKQRTHSSVITCVAAVLL